MFLVDSSVYKEIGEFWDAHDLTEFWDQTRKTLFEVDIESEVEPYGLKSMAPPHASSGGTLRSTLLTFIV